VRFSFSYVHRALDLPRLHFVRKSRPFGLRSWLRMQRFSQYVTSCLEA
jgi:hypothetical protein